MDLGGPKLRTGTISRGNHVVRWKVPKNARGSVISPARIAVTAKHARPEASLTVDAILQAPQALIRTAEPGDFLNIKDSC